MAKTTDDSQSVIEYKGRHSRRVSTTKFKQKNAATKMSDPQITAKELADLIEQLDRQHADMDRLRIIKAAGSSFSFSSEQIAELVKVQRYGDSAIRTSILLYPKTVNKDKFVELVLPQYRYAEERETVQKALNL